MNSYSFNVQPGESLPLLDSDTVGVILAAYAAGSYGYAGGTWDKPTLVVHTPFLLQVSTIISEITRDTSTSYSPMRLDKPYPVKNRLVCIQSDGTNLGSLTADMGDYIKLRLSSISDFYLFIGVCKSSLTDAYTPFASYFNGGSYGAGISFYDFGEILACAMEHLGEDAVTNNLSSADVSIPSWSKRPKSLSGSVGYDKKVSLPGVTFDGSNTPIY